jgi:uncharacterized DUF497 family protein
MEFTWDENKRRLNIQKHGIDFVDAEEIFDGEIVITQDDRLDYGETRYIAFGMLKQRGVKIIVVAYVERGETIRIISARKALKHEKNFYNQQIAN